MVYYIALTYMKLMHVAYHIAQRKVAHLLSSKQDFFSVLMSDRPALQPHVLDFYFVVLA